jgi:hypothetical protein
MGHRVGFNLGMASDNPSGNAAGAPPTPIDPRSFRGYSYLLGEPGEASRTTLGADPAKAREILQALYSLLPIGPNIDNPRIPSGYTYLLQFVAHDLVDSTVPFWAAAEAGVPSRNMRDEALGLDTLYGGGPTVCPIAFAPAGTMVDDRTRLRLGRIGDADRLGITDGACPLRDIARLKLETAPAPSNVEDPSQVYVADVRNDDNTLLSQVVVLFSIVHNALAAKLAVLGPQACFAHASTAVLLDRRVYDILNARPASSPDWLWRGDGIPLEFSHGAFRVGHAMVRPFYQFNTDNLFDVATMMGGPELGDSTRNPLPSNWIVEWSRFFAMGVTPNYSLKLAVHQQLPLDLIGLFNPIATDTPRHMTVRDWLSAANARMWRLDAIVAAAGPHYPELNFLQSAGIAAWIGALVKSSLGTAAAKTIVSQNSALLTTDLPLPLYIMLESQLDPTIDGAHMGPLGSIIVGETIFRRLAIAEAKLVSLIPAAQQAFGAADWGMIQSIGSMPDLIRLAEEWGDLESCSQMPFIAP